MNWLLVFTWLVSVFVAYWFGRYTEWSIAQAEFKAFLELIKNRGSIK